jgi:hypothetical protein
VRFRASGIHVPVPNQLSKTSSNDRPSCLENSRRVAAKFTSYSNSATFHFRLNQDTSAPACSILGGLDVETDAYELEFVLDQM